MTTASILALVESIERRGADAPAIRAFRNALTAAADPRRAAARAAILAAAWPGLMGWNA